MSRGEAFLVVGYDGGAVARISFAGEQQAEEARRLLLEAMTTPIPAGRSAYVNVTDRASVLAERVVFAYVENPKRSN